MLTGINRLLWQQFGAAIDMLENAVTACPEVIWENDAGYCQLAHHTIFFLDYYLSDTPKEADYIPPPPFTKSEFETVAPSLHYTKAELLIFLHTGKKKLHEQLLKHTGEALLENRFVSEYKDFSLFELLLYNMRHVQHHAAQLNLRLRQAGHAPPDWVSAATAPF
ncbi:DinB family protein [Niabella beijingensis]|uniref:DinB family protein n=1 Tax=Niabella beijingensis TaxID=2872700 RepID=UPI001CBBB169|nr:DinB family protein [Niabella beijingensis]MBZ4191904.1 DinB family protein [Niabella beijingensis]